MFETSLFLMIYSILINILIPIIPGILFLWLFYGTKFCGLSLYLLAFFLGTLVSSHFLFNLQFIHFGIGVVEYFVLIALLLGFWGWVTMRRNDFKDYMKTLKISFSITRVIKEFKKESIIKRALIIFACLYIVGFSFTAFLFTTNFPSYSDDTFYNWNHPTTNIYYDGGVKMYGDQNEILGRGRLGYPIIIPIYKALISNFTGGFNDIYINLWQWLIYIALFTFIFHITFKKTESILLSIIPLVLISGLPLVFFHITEGYLDFPSAAYSVLTIYCFYEFCTSKQEQYISLGLLFGFFTANIKNDGLVIYLLGILIAFSIYQILTKDLISNTKKLIKFHKNELCKIGFYLSFILLPFIIIKTFLGIGYNQAAGESNGITFSFHPEIFKVFPQIFFSQDNYNIALIITVFLFGAVIKSKKIQDMFILLSFVFITILFIAVFLFTENYLWVINQTTVNRVFTMCFIILFSFSGIILYEKKNI